MKQVSYEQALSVAHETASQWLAGLPDRAVGPRTTPGALHAAIDRPVPATAADHVEVIRELAEAIEPGLTATGSGRYLGFVNGGCLPAALAADWLVSAWDQNTPFADPYPGTAAFEEVAGRWVREILDLPGDAAVGFVTGAQMANTTCLAAARNRVLAAHGHDVERDGLIGAPRLRVVVGAERHSTIDRSLRLLGLGDGSLTVVPADREGRMDADALASLLASDDAATIVCAQAGNVNGGAFDPLADVTGAVEAAREQRAEDDLWCHVDGAFGLWVRASTTFGALAAGAERADSWATDAHKWLNTPYDCGLAIVSDADALRRAMGLRASYLPDAGGTVGDPIDRSPEASRRARALVVWAAIASLGREGLEAMVDECCHHAERFASRLATGPGVEVLHQEINQLVVAFAAPDGSDDDHVRGVLERVQREGTCYPTGTNWQGRAAMRISVSNWLTDSHDVDASVAAILAAHEGRLP